MPELGAGKGFPGIASIPSTAEKEGEHMNYVGNDKKLSPLSFTVRENQHPPVGAWKGISVYISRYNFYIEDCGYTK